MTFASHHTGTAFNYWLKAFALYALTEACIQLLFFIVLNYFGSVQVSVIEIHILMWFFQCLLILPIWWVAWQVRQKKLILQVTVNIVFYIMYSFIWFGPVQDMIGFCYDHLLEITRTPENRIPAVLDKGSESSYLNYQLLKHAFRLAWFYMAAFFYTYRQEEKERIQLAVANKELQLKMLKWHLNPSFYFKTIDHLRSLTAIKPVNATAPILQLAKVMEYVIYEAKEKMIALKKEIQFLDNYLELKNQQAGNNASILMQVEGDYEKLKIAPLLLTGIIDEIIGDETAKKNECLLELKFSGNTLDLKITGDLAGKPDLFSPANPLNKRLEDLYPGRYRLQHLKQNNGYKLNLQLDEA